MKTFEIILNHFAYFASSFAAQFLVFEIRMTKEISKREIRNGKQPVMANYIYLKNNFNRLVMIITQNKIFFTEKMCIYDD